MTKDLSMKDDAQKKNSPEKGTLGEALKSHGVSRRSFMKFCATTASMMALPPSMIPMIAQALEKAKRPSVIWLSFQECTGCTESLTRAHTSTLESLIFDSISLDYRFIWRAWSFPNARGSAGGPSPDPASFSIFFMLKTPI